MKKDPVSAQDFAGEDPEDAAALARLLANLGEAKSFENYAAFLDGRDELRAEIVRKAASTAFEGGAHPARSPRGVSKAWLRTLGWDWYPLVAELDFEPWSAIARWVRPVVTLDPVPCSDDEIPLGASKFGGAPDLPPGSEWPAWKEGPMAFLAQVDFADLRGSQAALREDLPEAGLLMLFAANNPDTGIQPGVVAKDEATGKYAEIPGLTKLIYVPPGEKLARSPILASLVESEQAAPSCRLTFSECLDLPRPEDSGDAALTDEDVEGFVSELRAAYLGPSRLFGYSVHSRTSNTAPGTAWRCLFSLASEEALDWSWCDGERLAVYVHEEALADRSFDRVSGYAA